MWVSVPDILLTVIPTVIFCSILAHDAALLVRWPTFIVRIARWLATPFTNFITLEDLDDVEKLTSKPTVWTMWALLGLAWLQTVGWVAYGIFGLFIERAEVYPAVVIGTISWAYASVRVYVKPPSSPPYLLICLATTYIVAVLYEFFDGLWGGIPALSALLLAARMIVSSTFIWVAGCLPIKPVLPGRNVSAVGSIPSSSTSCPEDRVTLWEWCTFSFVQPILDLAMIRTLNDSDIWSLSLFFLHKNLFKAYLDYCARHPSHSLLRFLLVSNSLDLILDVSLEMWSAVIGFLSPYALQQILSALSDPTPDARRVAYKWAFYMFLANLSFAQVDLFQRWHTRRCYERTRGQLFCALHYKALKRRDVTGIVQNAEDEASSADLGKIVNLMQGDAYAVAQRFWEFSGVFASPIRLGIALVFLYNVLGWSSLLGVAVVCVTYVLNYPLAKYNIYLTRSSWKAKDKRMSIVNELFQNIRFLKTTAWEQAWANKARKAREAELKWRVKENIVQTIISLLWSRIPEVTALVCFICYTLITGERLTVAKAFTSLALFSNLQQPMMELPQQLLALLHAYVSMQRIEKFLAEGEVPEWASSLTTSDKSFNKHKLGFENARLEWPTSLPNSNVPTGPKFTLGPLDIEIPRERLTLICGGTSSGKSALLLSLLGEMECISGHVHLDKTGHQVAYCGQQPWLEHATIRNNITFGASCGYNNTRYQAVLDACALRKDLELFDAGDMTEIGERGITLSGGQRARIAMARALYSDAKYILLDDPLAAVDMHTAQHLVKNALTGKLAQGRTIILVTHHVRLCLPVTAYIVELAHGSVLYQGTPAELQHFNVLQKVIEEEDHVKPDPGPSVIEQSSLNEADDESARHEDINAKNLDGVLVEEEARAEGRVSLQTYKTYFKASGYVTWVFIIISILLSRALSFGRQLFIAKWGEAYETRLTRLLAVLRSPLDDLPPPAQDVRPWFIIFGGIFIVGSLLMLALLSLSYYASLQASRKLFERMLSSLTRAPGRFFDKTPVGRILNRFTSDIGTVDGALQVSARSALLGVFEFATTFAAIVWVIPQFIPAAIFIAWLYIRLAPPYVQASRDLRRLESISLSPAFSGFDEMLRGITHIRAFAMENRFQNTFYGKVDKFQTFDHVYWLVSNWLSWRYDALGSVVVFAATAFALFGHVSDGYAALVIVQAQEFANASRYLVRVLAQLELDFNSVDRIVEYLDVSQEKPLIIKETQPPAYWPSSSGQVVVEDLVVRYAPGLPAVLKGINLVIKSSEKIGLVGRTGSGKSTLGLSLLRLVEADSGKIIVDGIDISKIGLQDLRTRITLVSQDASLFSGSLRDNLDPLEEHTDAECWDVLERIHLKQLLERGTKEAISLDMPVSQNSLSAGEKQLLALARAILRRTNVIILDESTAQVDQALDDKIQETIRTELSYACIVTIAHRLRTIIDYDRILVLGDGEILEFDNPRTLLSREDSVFGNLCRHSPDWPLLQEIASKV